MQTKLLFLCTLIALISLCNFSNCQTKEQKYIIPKKNGNIVLAYKAFDDFLNSNRSWENYKSMVLDAYPAVQKVHRRQIEWGSVDTIKFPNDLRQYKKEDFKRYINQYDLKTVNFLYDSVIERAHKILPPAKNKAVDLCFFLPYGSCFVISEDTLNTIFISMRINPNEVEKIMTHEYAHILHFSRQPAESLTLRREIISEGMAVYLTTQIVSNLEVVHSIPFMSEQAFEWCMNHEGIIKDSIKLELSDTTMRLFKRYISDGGFARPPDGFVQKTGYFIGYRIIERCIKKGMSLEDICSLDSESVIRISEYFDEK
jgi:uncharacterized protein YjaZ